METETVSFFTDLDLLLGNTRSNALVVTRVEVSMKNINNRNTMSVIDDMLKSGLTLFLVRNPISFNYELIKLVREVGR